VSAGPGVGIVALDPGNGMHVQRAAEVLFREMAHHHPDAWPTMADARREVMDSLGDGRISRVALVEHQVVGWIGAIPQYDGNVFELHPLVVDGAHQRQGIGSLLIADLERMVAARGAYTLWLGTDDEDQGTSVGGVDLYPDVLERLSALESRNGHPFEFYLKCGFVPVGILPDANGPGKPDIYMAKRVGERR
jgi:aminoglycoside 6'-N-acetyltransferase I